MTEQSTIFPIFLRAEYRDNQALNRFQSDAQRAAQAAKREFQGVGAALDAALSRGPGAGQPLNLGLPDLREAVRAQEQLATAADEVAAATLAAATANGQFDVSLTSAARGALEFRNAQSANLEQMRSQLQVLERVDAQLRTTESAASALTGANLRLAQAEAGAVNGAALLEGIYRGTAQELGRVANSARESAGAFELLFQAQDARSVSAAQTFFNVAAGIDQQTKSARDSAFAMEDLFAAQERAQVSARQLSGSYIELARAEAEAANGANLVAAALSGTALEQGRVTNSARASAQAFESAFNAQEQAARSAASSLAALRAEINPAAAAQERFNQRVGLARGALDRGEISQREYAQAVRIASASLREAGQAEVAAAAARNGFTTATRAATTARGNVINSARAERTAFIQLGQQLQDVTIQAQLGTNAFQIFAQQVPQAAFALTGLERSASASRAAIGRVATFLSGPWGAAIFAGTAVLGPFIARLFESTDAADDFSDALERIETRAQAATTALVNLRNQRIRDSVSELQEAERSVREQQRLIQEGAEAIRALQDRPAGQFRDRALGALREGQVRRLAELRERELDLDRARQNEAERLERESRRGRSRRGRDPSREAEQLERFGERAEERIARITERFDDQVRLIDQASQATRELDRLIGELGERQPEGYRQLIDDAIEAQAIIQDALVRPFEDLVRQSDERLQIERLLAQGRQDEAAALRITFQLQEQIGDLTAEQREEIEDNVRFERERTAELRAQADLLEAQADVARTVADELRTLFSGRQTDFFGNIRQSLLDVQGERLFRDLFGTTFDDLQNELRGNSPQARATREYVDQVERTTTAAEELEQSSLSLAAAFDQVLARATGAALPANDNEIVVTGNSSNAVGIERQSIEQLADRMAAEVVGGLTPELEDIFGTQFAGQLSVVLTSTLAGAFRAGTPGAILGGLGGLSDALLGSESGVSRGLDRALTGAQTGTTVSAISNALGINTSSRGAQLGGVAGSFVPIPGGDIIGALAGSLLSGIFGGTPRGSSTIGNVGGSLGITGTRGSSSSREAASLDLADQVLDTVNRLAEQLDATVNASLGAVSLGVRNDDIRVDRSGQGITKTRNGAVDFGDDAEGAVRFATRDLIQDGVIQGLSDAENRLLQAGNSLEDSIQDVLDFRSVFDRLAEIRDPLGFSISELDEEFEDLIDLFNRAGASVEEFAELEELYTLERERLITESNERINSSLRSLLNDLTIGDSGLSLRQRRENALGDFNDLSARVRAGDTEAFDDFADISRQLLDIERQIFGSTEDYFRRLDEITTLTEQALGEGGIGQGPGFNSLTETPFGPQIEPNRGIETMTTEFTGSIGALNVDVTGSIDAQTQQLVQRLDAVNDNLAALGSLIVANGGSVSPNLQPIAVNNF